MSAPTAYAYQWRRGGASIAGATASTYALVSADAGQSVDCLVTASNTGGSASQASNALAIPASAPSSVWSASDAAANAMTLSNGGLTVTPTTAGTGYGTVRTTNSKTTGKLYIELLNSGPTLTVIQLFFGLANAGFSPVDYLGDNPISAGVSPGNGTYTSGGGFAQNYGLPSIFPAANDVWSIAVDFSAGRVWMAQNNVWANSSNPGTGSLPMLSFTPATAGALFAAISFYGPSSASLGKWTLQPTAASQKYAPPSGFVAWDGGVAPPPTSVWSAADAAANGMTLSNGGATVSSTIPGWNTVRGTIGKTTGKLYFETVTSTAVTTPHYAGIGIATGDTASSGLPDNYLGSFTFSGGAYLFGSQFASGAITWAYGFAAADAAVGDVLGFAVDLDAGKGWISYNGAWVGGGNPATGANPACTFTLLEKTTTPIFPGMSLQAGATGTWTLHGAAASQKYAPPSGFSAWDAP